MRKLDWAWFAAFTAVFAVLAAYVFWGTWSPDVAPVMPDDTVWHPIAFADQFSRALRDWLASGVFVPTLPFWNGLLPKYGVQELKYVVGLYVSALGLVYFLRGRGLSRLASYGAGLLLGFCGYWTTLFSAGHGTWFLLMASVVPAFAFLDRAIASGKWRYWIFFGACVGWGTCHQQDIFLLFFMLLCAYGVYACIRERTFPWKGAIAAALVCLIVGGPGIRGAFTDALAGREKQIGESSGTALTGGKDQNDAEGRWIFVTNWSMPPEDTLEFFIPRIHGDTSCPMTLQLGRAAGKDVKPYTGRLGRPINAPSGNYRQHSLYVGWVTCLLALIAIVGAALRLKKHPLSTSTSNLNLSVADVLFFAIAALVLWLISMGRFCEPVYRLIYLLPFGDTIRCPVKWHHLTELCLCVLAGYGLDFLWRRFAVDAMVPIAPSSRKTPVKIAIVALVLFGAFDLARNDKLFCAPIDLAIVCNRNAAADDCVRLGKGTVTDLLEGGRGLLGWSFAARGIGMNADPNATDTRFVLAGNEQVKRTPQLAAWLKAKTTPVGSYVLTQKGIRSAGPQGSNVSLYQVKDVPPPPAPETPPPDPKVLALGILSLAGTLFACGLFTWDVVKAHRCANIV